MNPKTLKLKHLVETVAASKSEMYQGVYQKIWWPQTSLNRCSKH